MGIQRHFLGFETSALDATVEFLVARFAEGSELDLSQVVLVTSSGRAGRRLQELLILRAAESKLRFYPPAVIQPGQLPELLYEPQRPYADDLTQRLAWCEALRGFNAQELASVFAQLPDLHDTGRWLSLAAALARLHRELAAEGLHFGDIASRGGEVTGFDEVQRWQTLRRVQEAYLAILDAEELWDQQTARLYAIEHRECATQKQIVLVATVDMNRAMRQMLDQIEGQVTALIHAPDSFGERFDPHGCLVASAWQDVPLRIPEENIVVAGGPADQAEAVARQVAAFDARFAADEIVIGVPNESLVTDIQRSLAEAGQPTRWVTGRTLPETGPYRLLEAVADLLDGRRFSALASLLRHPDLEHWLKSLGAEEGWLTELDKYRREHIPARLGKRWLGSPKSTTCLRAAFELVQQSLAPLTTADNEIASLAGATRQFLTTIYGDRELSRLVETENYLFSSCGKIDRALDSLALVPPKLRPNCTAGQFLRLLLEEVAGETIASPVDAEAIELLGWLELPLDDAPALILTSVNDGFVPASVNADPFMPNRLRQTLALLDNDRRLARDAYALTVVFATRDDVTLILGRRDAAGDPLSPSRLLFHDTPETITHRALRLFGPSDAAPRRRPEVATPSKSSFYVPKPKPAPELEELAVTAFRSYLQCPYRFYLGRVLRLQALDDDLEELDPVGFGNLMHDVLARFGESDQRHLEDPAEISDFLLTTLQKLAAQKFGQLHLPPIEVQLAQLRARLTAFAEWQAAWVREGWRIEQTEWGPDPRDAPFEVDGKSLRLRGRIDRIDRHVETGEWYLFDYKSSTKAKTPEKAHRDSSGEWVDLQLPLYRYVVQSLEIERPTLGYIVLPRDLKQVGELRADWTAADLTAADEAAAEVVREIRVQRFWPPTDLDAAYDDFASICQSGVFDRQWEGGVAPDSVPTGEPSDEVDGSI